MSIQTNKVYVQRLTLSFVIVMSDNLNSRKDGRSVCFGICSDTDVLCGQNLALILVSIICRLALRQINHHLVFGCNLKKAVDTRDARHTDIQITCVLKRGTGYPPHSKKQRTKIIL